MPTLREIRRARGLKLKEVASQAQIAPCYLSQIENGKATPSPWAVNRIAKALGMNLNEILMALALSGVNVKNITLDPEYQQVEKDNKAKVNR
jgi:transcriptional regulator with XRE-family HTH domain